jgi:hypothetical protein
MKDHWSSCAIYNAPALPVGPCDCGGLELTSDDAHDGVGRIVSGPGSLRPLLCYEGTGGFVQTQQFPANGFIADAAASDLPNSHDGIVVLREPDRVDLDIAGVTIVPKLQDVT